MKKLNGLIALLLIVLIPCKTFAGYPIGKYRKVVVPSFFYYHQTDRFDNNGHIVHGARGTGFTSYAASIYFGYGISRRLDFIASLPYLYQMNTIGAGNTIYNHGAGDFIAGLSYNLINFNYTRYLSVQVSGIVPLYKNPNGTSALGLGDYGTEIKLMYTGALPKAIAGKGYFNTEIGYRRYYSSQGPDQLTFLGSVGYPISWHNQLTLDVSFNRSFSSDKTYNANLFAEKDYAFFKPQLNFGHQFTHRFTGFIGGYYEPFGLNTGVGYGGSVFAVFKL